MILLFIIVIKFFFLIKDVKNRDACDILRDNRFIFYYKYQFIFKKT